MTIARSTRPILFALTLLLGCAALLAGAQERTEPPRVIVAHLADTIHPISAEYIVQSLAQAAEVRADLFVLQLDTPGGLDTSMREIIQAMLASPVPVCLYVGPSGARAASAGFFMAMAADVVVMAPNTNMGAASPVPVGAGEIDDTMKRKLMQDAEAYIRSLADDHGRPADRAAAAVTEGASYSAAEAVDLGLADFTARDIDELLAGVDGRVLSRAGRDRVLATAGAEIRTLELSLRQRILSIIANPNIAYVLMLIGLAGLYFELSTPGAILPGVLGAISLVLGLLSFQLLPIDYAGLALIALAVLFFILEVKIVSYGLLTVAGLVSFVLGSLMLFPGPIPEMRLQLGFVLPTALSVAGIAAFLLWLVIKTHQGKVQTGPAGLVSRVGRATERFGPGTTGRVFVHGELWRAASDIEVRAGEAVEVVGLESGMLIRVRPRAHEKGS